MRSAPRRTPDVGFVEAANCSSLDKDVYLCRDMRLLRGCTLTFASGGEMTNEISRNVLLFKEEDDDDDVPAATSKRENSE